MFYLIRHEAVEVLEAQESNMHPLINDLSSLSDNDLDEKITSLMKRIRGTPNPQSMAQLQMIMESYINERDARLAKKMHSDERLKAMFDNIDIE